WGARARTIDEAKAKDQFIAKDFEVAVCPSDGVQLATPFYPRNKGSGNDGLRGDGNPADPTPSAVNMSYWGRLSYGPNEDIVGAETSESNGHPACFRVVWQSNIDCVPCRGEFGYPPSHPCGGSREGWRLRGEIDKIYQPGDVGLLFEVGRDEETDSITGFANLVLSAQTYGPYLGDFQQFHNARMPTTRHPKGALNVLFADMHGRTVRPVEVQNGVPSEYAPLVRGSPYPPGLE